MQGSNYLTQDEAAVLCGKSKDTIRRYRREGRLANSRTRPDGTVEIAVSDLVAAGLLDPLAAAGDVAVVATRSRVERDLVTSRQEVAMLQARCEGLVGAIHRNCACDEQNLKWSDIVVSRPGQN